MESRKAEKGANSFVLYMLGERAKGRFLHSHGRDAVKEMAQEWGRMSDNENKNNHFADNKY
jgi:hypothetical protein